MEVAGRVGNSLGGLRATPGGFPLRVWGISSNQLGATASAASILGLDADRMQHALGLAAYHAPVPSHVKYNYTKEVGYAKYGPSGWMAQAGVTTALLAEMGYRGDTSFLETERGFWAMNGAPSWNPAKITEGLGQDWVFTNAGYKYWPTCGFYQSPLDAFTKIIEDHDLQPEEITKSSTGSRNSQASRNTSPPSLGIMSRQRRAGPMSLRLPRIASNWVRAGRPSR